MVLGVVISFFGFLLALDLRAAFLEDFALTALCTVDADAALDF